MNPQLALTVTLDLSFLAWVGLPGSDHCQFRYSAYKLQLFLPKVERQD